MSGCQVQDRDTPATFPLSLSTRHTKHTLREAQRRGQSPSIGSGGGLEGAPTAPAGKCAREKELAGFLGDIRVFPPPCHGKRPSAAEGSHLVARESKGKATRKMVLTQSGP